MGEYTLILPEKIEPVLGHDGRHKAVPLMAKDKRFDDTEGKAPFHPRLGEISHGHGHASHAQAEAIAKEFCNRYNSYSGTIKALQEIRHIAEEARLATYKGEALEQISAKAYEILTTL